MKPSSTSVAGNASPGRSGERRSEQPRAIRGPIVDYTYVVDHEFFYDGDEIVREGSYGNWIWVILEGAAEIIKGTTSGPIKLLRGERRRLLGSLASLLRGEHVRNTTVIASGNIQLGMLDSQVLANEVISLSPDFKTLIKSMDNRLRHLTTIAAQAHDREARLPHAVASNKKIVIEQGQNGRRLSTFARGRWWWRAIRLPAM